MTADRVRELWLSVEGDRQPPLVQGLILEAGRLRTRLDKLDAQLTGRQDEWLRLQTDGDGDLVVVVDRAISEARALALAYARLVAELRASGVAVAAEPGKASGDGEDLVDELAARRDRHPA